MRVDIHLGGILLAARRRFLRLSGGNSLSLDTRSCAKQQSGRKRASCGTSQPASVISHNVYYVKRRAVGALGSGMSAPRASASFAIVACCRAKRARPSSASACARSTTGRPAVRAYRSVRCACCASCVWATSARSAMTGPAGRSTGWACTTRPAAPTAWTPCARGGSPSSRPAFGGSESRCPVVEAGAGAPHLFRLPRAPRPHPKPWGWRGAPPPVTLLCCR